MSKTDPHALLAALAKLENLRYSGSGRGLKRQRRCVIRGDGELHPLDPGKLDRSPLAIQLRDVGWGGMGFISQQSLPVGSVWRVCFLNHGYVVGTEAMIVRHCREVMNGVYLSGGQFCVEPGVMHTLGVEPAIASEWDDPTLQSTFLSPSEVA